MTRISGKIANLKNLENETVYPKTIAQAVIGLPSLSESNFYAL